jgi:type III secretory pathway component EscR
MTHSILTSLSQRNEAFWIGLVLLLSGGLVPENIYIGTTLAGILIGLGVLIITIRILVAVVVILQTAFEGWQYGYAKEQLDD